MKFVIHFRKRAFLSDIRPITFTALFCGIVSGFLIYVRVYPAPLLPVGVFLFFAYPWLWRFFRVAFSQEPALIVDSTGILFSLVYIPGKFFISWSSIQKISVEKYYSEDCICIYPKDWQKYLSHLPFFERLSMYLWKSRKQVALIIALKYLTKPAAETFQQLSNEFANELQEHGIQLQF